MVPECRQNGPKGVPRTSSNVRAVLAPVLLPKVAPRGLKRVPNGAPMGPKRVISKPLCFPASVRGRLGIRRCPPRRKVSLMAPKWMDMGAIFKIILSYFWSETECYSQAVQHAFLLAGLLFFYSFCRPERRRKGHQMRVFTSMRFATPKEKQK